MSVPTEPTYPNTTSALSTTVTNRSTEMYTMHEALAREHMRQLHQDARRRALVSELASANRWRFLERRAHAAYRRHAQRAEQSLAASAATAH